MTDGATDASDGSASAPPGPGSDHRVPVLNRKREQARAGEITVGAFHQACRQYVLRTWVTPAARGYLRDLDTEEVAAHALANAVIAEGELLDAVDWVASYLHTIVTRLLATEYGVEKRRKDSVPVTSLEELGERGVQVSGEGLPAWSEDTRDEDTTPAAAAVGDAQSVVRRRLPRLGAAAANGECLFHHQASAFGLAQAACPHHGQVIEVIGKIVRYDPLLSAADAAAVIQAQGRSFGLNDRDHSLDRDFRRCFEWWWYQALKDTALDRPIGVAGQPTGSASTLLLPVVGRLRLKKNGKWDSVACPLKGAVATIATDRGLSQLLRSVKRDVYDYLERGAS